MGKLKISEDLFLGVQELNKMMFFLKEEERERMMDNFISSSGIIPTSDEIMGNYFEVSASSTANKIDIQPGLAYNRFLEGIVSENIESLDIAIAAATDYYIILQRKVKEWEEGTVTVDAVGNMVGVGTKFTETLRGQPNFPVKVMFHWDGLYYEGEYEVLQVIDDENAILQGDFTTSIPQRNYIVHGAFSPDYTPTLDQKRIYEYDSFEFLIASVAEGSLAPTITAGEQFFLAKVQNLADDSVTVINDMRFDSSRFSMKILFDNYQFHKDTKENLFEKLSILRQRSIAVSVTSSTISQGIMGYDAVEPYMEVDLSTWNASNLTGFLKEYSANGFYEPGTVLILKRIDDHTIWPAKLLRSTYNPSHPYGFEDYASWLFTAGAQTSDRYWKQNEIIIVQCVENEIDGTVFYTKWRILQHLSSDTEYLNDRISSVSSAASAASTNVYVNGEGGITDTASADAAGAKEGDIYIS